MPEFKYFKTFEKDALANGATYEDSWVIDEDIVIRRIFIRLKDGTKPVKSTFWYEIPGRTFTKPVIPCAELGEDILVTPILDITFTKGEKLNWVLKNSEGAAKDWFLTFECWTK